MTYDDAGSKTGARHPELRELLLSSVLRALPIKNGKHRILDIIKPTKWASSSDLVSFSYGGKTIKIDISDLVGWHLLILRSFDPEVPETLLRFKSTDEADVFWDIGANKGSCSYRIATQYPKCRIVAIEPQTRLAKMLEANLSFVAPGRSEVFPVGLGVKSEELELYVPQDNFGAASLVYHRGEGEIVESEIQTVRVRTADDIVGESRFGWPTLVKIDVEGFELEVIRSLAGAFSARRINCCVFESHERDAQNFQEIHAIVGQFGYKVHAIRRSPFSTWLEETASQVKGAGDYAIVRTS